MITALKDLASGVAQGKLYFEEYHPSWAEAGRRAVLALQRAIPQAAEIRHVGSTSVQGMYAKPLIDMLVGLEEGVELSPSLPELSRLGLQDFGEVIPGDRVLYLNDPDTGKRVLHVHVVPWRTESWYRYVDITDFLQADERARQAYIYLKKALLLRYEDRPLLYNPAKSQFLADLRADAKAWRASRETGGEP